MHRKLLHLGLIWATTIAAMAESLTLPTNVVLKSEHNLSSLKAGTVVEVISRDEKTLTVRTNSQVGTISASSLNALPPVVAAAGTTPSEKPKPSLTIAGQKFILAYASPDTPEGRMREYLLAGDTPQHWNRLASVRVYPDQSDGPAFLQKVGAEIMKNQPGAQAQLLKNNDTQELILDFLLFSPPNQPEPFAEWNLMRARYVSGQGLVVCKYAVHFFKPNASLGAQINNSRERLMAEFIKASFLEQ